MKRENDLNPSEKLQREKILHFRNNEQKEHGSKGTSLMLLEYEKEEWDLQFDDFYSTTIHLFVVNFVIK